MNNFSCAVVPCVEPDPYWIHCCAYERILEGQCSSLNFHFTHLLLPSHSHSHSLGVLRRMTSFISLTFSHITYCLCVCVCRCVCIWVLHNKDFSCPQLTSEAYKCENTHLFEACNKWPHKPKLDEVKCIGHFSDINKHRHTEFRWLTGMQNHPVSKIQRDRAEREIAFFQFYGRNGCQ